jgi:glycosyltransferase involved in cell wall biosynthesis
MARRAVEILSNDAQHRAFSEAARRVAVERYDVSRIIPMYEEFYSRVSAGAVVV